MKEAVSYGILKGEFVNCVLCGEGVYRKPYSIKNNKSGIYFCSKKCYYEFYKQNLITISCELCGNDLTITEFNYNQPTHKFCCLDCKNQWHSESMKGENNPAYIGRELAVLTCDNCGTEYQHAHHYYRETKYNFCSKQCQGEFASKHLVGDKAPCWQGGITEFTRLLRNSKDVQDWRTSVFKRDNYTCQDCGKKGGYLEAHHIITFSQIIKQNNVTNLDEARLTPLLWDIDNGKTLCYECHKLEHSTRGEL